MHVLELLGEGLWKVALVGILLGAGLPALFAFGIRFTSPATAGAGGTTGAPANPALKTLGWICFALVAIGIIMGVGIIVAGGFKYHLVFDQFPPFVKQK